MVNVRGLEAGRSKCLKPVETIPNVDLLINLHSKVHFA